MVLVEAVNLVEAVGFGYHRASQTYVNQHACLTSCCSQLHQVKQARNSLAKMASKNLVLQQLMRGGKYDLYQL